MPPVFHFEPNLNSRSIHPLTNKSPMAALFWFTNDLRLTDNPGLAAAARDHDHVIPLYILDDNDPWAPGGASRWWLHHSLTSLQRDIKRQDGALALHCDDTVKTIIDLVKRLSVEAVYFSRAYEPWLAQVQQTLFETLRSNGVTCKRFGSRLLIEPDQIYNQQGKPFQVFTPFYRNVKQTLSFGSPIDMPKIQWFSGNVLDVEHTELQDWLLRPEKPDWAQSFSDLWQPGEEGAHRALTRSVNDVIEYYDTERDVPAQAGTSRLSPFLHYGEISPRQVWHEVTKHSAASHDTSEPFLRQLVWREFSYYLLHHWPQIVDKPFKKHFVNFSWQKDKKALTAWQRGLTGYPIVDAGMRELWHTGWMHNRVRMIVASFLTKHLRIHWLEGAKWFWDTLLDADLANNSASWQWVAGSGADAAPYFRIFNPTLQGEKFDKKGHYIRRWIPELNNLPDKYIHTPWLAPSHVLEDAGVTLGREYPAPIVDHKQAREAALSAYHVLAESKAYALGESAH